MKSYGVRFEEARMKKVLAHWQEKSPIKVTVGQVLRALLEKEEERIKRDGSDKERLVLRSS